MDGGGIGNWVDFGRELKAEIPPNKLRQFAKPYSCTEEVLKIIQKREYPEVTVGKMKTTLRDLGRMDVCRALNSLQGKRKLFLAFQPLATPTQRRRREKTKQKR